MPDVNNFESELKRSKNGKRKSSGAFRRNEDNDEGETDDNGTEVRPVKKQKTKDTVDRSKLTSRLNTEASEDGPPSSFVTHSKGSKRAANDSDDDEEEEEEEEKDDKRGSAKKVRIEKTDSEARYVFFGLNIAIPSLTY
jgi:hypothetical protein